MYLFLFLDSILNTKIILNGFNINAVLLTCGNKTKTKNFIVNFSGTVLVDSHYK